MSSVTLSQDAYTTLLLHCAKYPASTVTGMLVGSTTDKTTTVVQTIPLQHHWNQLSPMLEVGLGLIEAHLASQKQSPVLRLVGVYYAPNDVATSTRNELTPTALKVAQTIAAKLGGDAVALQINNAKLSLQEKDGHPFNGFTVSASGGQAKGLSDTSVKLASASILTFAKAAVAKGSWKQLIDFDDHLEDTSRDWLNPITA